MLPTLIRLECDARELTAAVDAVGDTAISFWKAAALTIEAGFFDRTTPLVLTDLESITLRVRGARTGGAHLMESTVEAADFGSMTLTQWEAGTHQQATFTFDQADTNLDVLDGQTQRELWLVISALTSTGNRIILATAPVLLIDPNYDVDETIDPPSPSDPNMSIGEADAAIAARAVCYDRDQTLTDAQRWQALENLGFSYVRGCLRVLDTEGNVIHFPATAGEPPAL